MADGVSPITFTLTSLEDQYGNPPVEGTVITMTLSSSPTPVMAQVPVKDGRVIFSLPAFIRAGTYPITVASGAGALSLTGATEVTMVPGPPAQARVLSASPPVIVADGVQTSTVVLQVRDNFDNPVVPGLNPAVTSAPGLVLPGGGPTNAAGVLTRTVQSGLEVGPAQLSVAGIVATGPAPAFIPGPAVVAQVTMLTTTLRAGGYTTPVVFDVRDAWNHPVADSTIITPTLTPAYGTLSGVRQTTNGRVEQTLTSGTAVGTATISSPGLLVAGDTLITFVPGPGALARLTAWPTRLPVGETTLLTITVTDAYSNVVPPTSISLTPLSGYLPGGSPQTTSPDAAIITATLTSTTAGTAILLLNGPNGALTLLPTSDSIEFLPGEPVDVTLSPAGPIQVTAGVTLTVTANSRDPYGNAIDAWTPVDYTWWQQTATGEPGDGLLNPVDEHAHAISFLPTRVGSYRLWATGGVKPSSALTVTVTSGAPAAAAAAVSPTSLPADGLSTFAFTLTQVVDAFGNPIPDGTPLTVTVQAIPPLITSGQISGGVLAGQLPSSRAAGVYPLTVTGSGGALTLGGGAVITFAPGVPVRAGVAASPRTLPADGVSKANLVITVRDQYGNLVADGTPITVTTTAGSLSGSGATVNGQVQRTLQAPVQLTTAGFTVSSAAGPLFVSGDTVTFVPGPPAMAMVTAVSPRLTADGLSTSVVTVTVKDGYGFTVPGSGAVGLAVNRGSLLPTNTVASAGVFTTTWRAGTIVGPAGLVATYEGISLATVGDSLELIPGPPVSATIAANPASLVVGSSQQARLTISLVDAWDHPVADGTAVTVTTSLGSLLPDNSSTQAGTVTRALLPGLTMGTVVFTVTTTAGTISPGGDRVTLTSGTLYSIELAPVGAASLVAGSAITVTATGYDLYGNKTGTDLFTWRLWPTTGYGQLSSSGLFTGTTAGKVGIQAALGTIYSSIKEVTILPGPPVTATVNATPTLIPVGGETSLLTITARDAFGNLVTNGTALTVTTNLGTVTGAAVTQNGSLTRTLVSGSYYGPATIIVNGFEASGDRVTFVPRSRVTATPSSLYADGLSQASLLIEVFDNQGVPVVDGTRPLVTTSAGNLNCDNAGTLGGKLNCTLQASLIPQVAKFYVDNLVAEGNIWFDIGPATVARISAAPTWLMADGLSQTHLVIQVEDSYGHVITNAGVLTVTTSLGAISGPAPTVAGVTTRVLTAGLTSGAARLTVTGLQSAGNSAIHFVGNSWQDGGFESGSLNSWSIGQLVTPTGAAPAYGAAILASDGIGGITVLPASGSAMARLGAVTVDKTDHYLSEGWIGQPIYVQPGGLTQLTFLYRILSYDVAVGALSNGSKEWDPFEVWLNDREVLQDGILWTEEWQNWYLNGPTFPKDMGWKQGVLDLTPYAGSVVTLQFRVANRQQPRDNTWVYLDNFNLKFVETKTYATFLPIVLH